jgi:plasmid maintenance system killer protein
MPFEFNGKIPKRCEQIMTVASAEHHKHQHSMRLNKQWRLIVEYPIRQQKTILIVGIEDYH